jgi:hypothetical protein
MLHIIVKELLRNWDLENNMHLVAKMSCALILSYALSMILTFVSKDSAAVAREESHIGKVLIQIEPETEEPGEVSEPVGELSEPAEDIPTEPLNMDSEPVGGVSEEAGEDVARPESLGEVSDTDDQASEEIGADSETADQASENLPGAPEGEEYGLEEDSPAEMPLGDREAEGRGIE